MCISICGVCVCVGMCVIMFCDTEADVSGHHNFDNNTNRIITFTVGFHVIRDLIKRQRTSLFKCLAFTIKNIKNSCRVFFILLSIRI